MTKVRIIGGGLMGVLAAFEAHRLGCRDIEIHERLETLGGDDLPDRPQGLELRDEQIEFGPRGGPMRQMLEWRGVRFDDTTLNTAASGEADWPKARADEPTIERRQPTSTGRSLADWIRAHPAEVAGPLGRYCQWRLSAWLDEVDESAAGPLGVDRRAADPLASPHGGLAYMFSVCRRALDDLGVLVRTEDLVSPRRALDALDAGEVVVWAADPTAFFGRDGSPAPKPLHVTTPTYFFRAEHEGFLPVHVRDFTPGGVLAAIHLYESRGQAVLAAECVAQASDAELRREIAHLAAASAVETLTVGEQLGVSLRPRRGFRSVEVVREIARLRERLGQAHGAAFVTDAWGIGHTPADRFAGLRKGLRAALDGRTPFLQAVA